MEERRRSPRYKISSSCKFYVLNKEEDKDFYGNLENISEEGVCIRISSEISPDYIRNNLKLDNIIHFQAFDDEDAGLSESDLFEADAEVLRIDEIGDEFSIGCRITNKTISFEDYVKHQIIEKYFNINK